MKSIEARACGRCDDIGLTCQTLPVFKGLRLIHISALGETRILAEKIEDCQFYKAYEREERIKTK